MSKLVTTTGTIERGKCSIKLDKCAADEKKINGVITFVRVDGQDKDIKVCNYCLNEQLRNLSWNIPGAKPSNLR